MIPIKRPREPKTFGAACRTPGLAWLKANPTKPPKDLWSRFEPVLRAAFHERCGWLAMWIAVGQIDHYLSKDHPNAARRKKQRPLAYEWRNLRYAEGTVNNRKRNRDADVLDPFEVKAGWFALDAALHLKVAAACPVKVRARAEFTLKHLGLDRGRTAMRLRKKYLQQFEDAVAHGMDEAAALEQLEHDAPLLAAYVRSLP